MILYNNITVPESFSVFDIHERQNSVQFFMNGPYGRFSVVIETKSRSTKKIAEMLAKAIGERYIRP